MPRANTRVGTRIAGRFRLKQILDSGGTATVWLADDEAEGGDVAVKMLHPKHRRSSAQLDRARREAEALEALSHPNITRLIAADLEVEQPFIVMSYVEGRSLAEVLSDCRTAGRPPDVQTLRHWFNAICSAVEHAHERGVVHRDLKPTNIMVTANSIQILDFGIAKLIDRDHHDETTRGRSVGTFCYMAPEQIRGDLMDHRVDIFALGAVLFEATTFTRAFGSSDDGMDVIAERILRGPRPLVSTVRPELQALDNIINKALAVDPERRPATVAALSKQIERALTPRTVDVRFPLTLAVALLLAATTLAIVITVAIRKPEPDVTVFIPALTPVRVVTPPAPVAVEPRPVVEAEPKAEPKPEIGLARRSVPRRTLRPSPPKKPSLEALLEAARAAPTDLAALQDLADGIKRRADDVGDTRARARIKRLADVGIMMRRLDGLERAHRALEEARR